MKLANKRLEKKKLKEHNNLLNPKGNVKQKLTVNAGGICNDDVSLSLCCAGSRGGPEILTLTSIHIWDKNRGQLWLWQSAIRGHHGAWSDSSCLQVAQMTHKLCKQLEIVNVFGRSQ